MPRICAVAGPASLHRLRPRIFGSPSCSAQGLGRLPLVSLLRISNITWCWLVPGESPPAELEDMAAAAARFPCQGFAPADSSLGRSPPFFDPDAGVRQTPPETPPADEVDSFQMHHPWVQTNALRVVLKGLAQVSHCDPSSGGGVRR